MNNLFLSHKYHSTTNNVVQSIPSSATNNVVKFRVDPSQAIKVAKSLGNSYTKSHSKNKKNTKSRKLTVSETQDHNQNTRKYLYDLQKESASILAGARVCVCSHCRANATHNVNIKATTRNVVENGKANKVTKAQIKNVFVCGDIWVCPVCAKKVFFERGREVRKAKDLHEERGKAVSMLTLTISHSVDDDLSMLLKGLSNARKRLFGDRNMREVFDFYKVIGHITNTEVTHGWQNGWHPHHHILMFSDYDMTKFLKDEIAVFPKYSRDGVLSYLYVNNEREKRLIRQGKSHLIEHVTFEHFLKVMWNKFCIAVGLGSTSYEHGLTLQNGERAGEYITKFQTALELTESMNKQGRKGNRNQWEILHDAMMGDANSKALFKSYAQAFHGKRQLTWSRGLKELFKIEDVEDEVILQADDIDENEASEVDEIKYIDIAFGHWLVISRNRLIPSILNMVEKLGVYSTVQYINDNFGDGCKTLVADSFEQLRQYDRKGNLLSGDDDKQQQDAKIILKENPYPSGSPSFDYWQQKYGLVDAV